MFVSGLPLAPLFALINNLFEIRIDAINYVVNFRRPVAQRAEDIGGFEPFILYLILYLKFHQMSVGEKRCICNEGIDRSAKFGHWIDFDFR